MARAAGRTDGGALGRAAAMAATSSRPHGADGAARQCYLRVLAWAFTLFNSVRMLAYVPTLWAIQESGDSSQHSLLTWLTWVGANLTMAGWLHERAGRRIDRAVAVNLGNSAMCITASAMIVWYRL